MGLTCLEGVEGLDTVNLTFVPVNCIGLNACTLQLACQSRTTLLGTHENDALANFTRPQQLGEQSTFAVFGYRMNTVRDGVGYLVAPGDFDQLGRFEQAVGQRLDVVAEGGAEQQALLVLRHDGQHLLDVVDEAHVEHAVGFVEHQDLDLGQVEVAQARVVEQAARRGHEDVHAVAQLVDLGLHAHAAEHDHALELGQVLAVGLHAFFDLGGEFARGGQHEGADGRAAALVERALAGLEAVQHGQREASGLAGAGLRAGQQVAALQHGGNGLRLDRRRVFVALFAHGAQQRLGEAEFGKAHGSQSKPREGGRCTVRRPLGGGRRLGRCGVRIS